MKYDPKNIRTIQDYNGLFMPKQRPRPRTPPSTNVEELLKNALDTRKFEIELYWKRATYFWAFIAAAFAGYFALVASDKIPPVEKNEALTVLECIGLVFSFGWFLANKGSKFWQENWEKHVDMLENHVYGPLYKTVLDNAEFSAFNIKDPFQFSVSKINQALSLFVVFVWFILLLRQASISFAFIEPFPAFNELVFGALTVWACWYLAFRTRGGIRVREFFFRSSKVIK